MELQNIDIDKYVCWYRELSGKLEYFNNNEWQINHYTLLAYRLHVRGMKNKDSRLNPGWEQDAEKRVQKLQKLKDELKQYLPVKDLPGLWYFPNTVEWLLFDKWIDGFTDTLKGFINGKLNASALPDKDILRNELERINEKEHPFLNCAISGTPLLMADGKGNNFGSWDMAFADFVSECYFAKWLQTRIDELDTAAASKLSTIKLLWKSSKAELSELIKALSLTALKGYSEAEIIRAFELIFEDKNGQPLNLKKRHTINLNELMNKKTKDLFTRKLCNELNEYLTKKLL